MSAGAIPAAVSRRPFTHQSAAGPRGFGAPSSCRAAACLCRRLPESPSLALARGSCASRKGLTDVPSADRRGASTTCCRATVCPLLRPLYAARSAVAFAPIRGGHRFLPVVTLSSRRRRPPPIRDTEVGGIDPAGCSATRGAALGHIALHPVHTAGGGGTLLGGRGRPGQVPVIALAVGHVLAVCHLAGRGLRGDDGI